MLVIYALQLFWISVAEIEYALVQVIVDKAVKLRNHYAFKILVKYLKAQLRIVKAHFIAVGVANE